MGAQHQSADAELITLLNDLNRLNLEAGEVCTFALENLGREDHRTTIRGFRDDHDRHVAELSTLVKNLGGLPINHPYLLSRPLKLALQSASNGGDRAVLAAFGANEKQLRGRYESAAGGSHPPEVAELIQRHAADEDAHHDWVRSALAELGATEGAVERAVGGAYRVAADALAAVERKPLEWIEKQRQDGG